MKKLVFTAVALMSLGYGYAQDNTVPMATLTPAQPIEPAQKVEEKVEIKSVGRIHFDGGVLGANNYHNQFVSGVALADFRAGLMMRYGQWKSKIEMGYANQALSVKDVFIDTILTSIPCLGEVIFCINSVCRVFLVLLLKYRWKNL